MRNSRNHCPAAGRLYLTFRFLLLVSLWFCLAPGAIGQRATRAEPGPAIDVEGTYYHQRDLIDAALAKIEPSRPNRPELYFVGFASFASQDVFKREVTAVRALFDERFGTRGRSLNLLNHRDDVTRVPLANASNLELVLAGMARRMDLEKDTLVLFITTHGAPERLAVDFPRFHMNDVSAVRLHETLNRSGIKNRILLISACYAGSFIPKLKDDRTLILAAARSDRTSFGCANEREWTYFGDALFNRALRQTFSLTEAFELAKSTVSGWEKTQKLLPSEPQMFVGKAISVRLEELARRLAAETSLSTAVQR
jgi:Peptidase C13 family